MTLATIANLLSYTPTAPDELVHVLGYNEAGDGGEGAFYWNNVSTEPADGGTIFNTVSTGRWKRLYNESVNVKWFGAVGNAGDPLSNDDSDAIQAAFNKNKSVYFPPGNYKITKTINVNLNYASIEGHSAYLRPNGSFTALNIKGYKLTYTGLHISFEDVPVGVCDENAVAIWFFKDGNNKNDQVMNSVFADFYIHYAHTGIKSSPGTGAVWQTEIRNIFMVINPGKSNIKAIGVDLAPPIAGADNTTLRVSKVSVQDFGVRDRGAGLRGMSIVGYSDVTILNFSCDFVVQTSLSVGEILYVVANQIAIKGLAAESITNTVGLISSDAGPIILVGGLGNKEDSVSIEDCLFINSRFNCGGPNAVGTWIVFRNHPKVTVGNIVNKFVTSDDGTTIKKIDSSLYRGKLNSVGNVSSTDIANFERNANNCVILADYAGEVRTTAPITATAIYPLIQPGQCCLVLVKGFDSINGNISFFDIVSVATSYSGLKTTAIVSSNKINYTPVNTYTIDANNNLVLTRSGGNTATIFAKTMSML
ncbi:MAG: hypothetical protein J7623_09945 [Chitinophaga sp.]|uniref:glycosyl hydrolase family 28-related protein n=1 Tax=Chitinophaga sp. TaxID=1869181 RepID=UPI001B1D66C3|nr:glycosyl hydrolase family 28-related protein [Chitinophaga sp.]MBO9728946.1 hypothetical protein [Chitinophaga sp.]